MASKPLSNGVKQFGKTSLEFNSLLAIGGTGFGSNFKYNDADALKPIENAEEVVREAIRVLGKPLFDTAPWYQNSQKVLGRVLTKFDRDSFAVSTKIGRYPDEASPAKAKFDFSAERTRKAVLENLADLQLNCIDLIQVHDVEFAEDISMIWTQTLPVLEAFKKAGKVKHIGVTGYDFEKFKVIIENSSVKIDSVLSYCRYTLLDRSLADSMAYFEARDVAVIVASPVSMGALSDIGPAEWHPIKYAPALHRATLEAIEECKNSGVSITRLAIKFTASLPGKATLVIGCLSSEQVKQNLALCSEPLTPEEIDFIDRLENKFFKHLPRREWLGEEIRVLKEQQQVKNEDKE